MVMSYFFIVSLVVVICGIVVMGVVEVPYQGVIALMGVSFFCCVFMTVLGRMFAALVMYIVYLGGLIVVFSYCVSVEKEGVNGISGVKYMVIFMFILIMGYLWWFEGMCGLLVYTSWEELVCLEVNGGGVMYSGGGASLVMCAWGLLVVLFSILVILSWSRLGGFRSF